MSVESRIERLSGLLENATQQSIRLAAATQLGELCHRNFRHHGPIILKKVFLSVLQFDTFMHGFEF